jgi:signal transduction histidine kinase
MAHVFEAGQVRRSELREAMMRLTKGLQMTTSNLQRASSLIDSFKQVAVDQADEQLKTIDLATWLSAFVSHLSPILSRYSLKIECACPPHVCLDTYPGALGQVISNLAINAGLHAYPQGTGGIFSIVVTELDDDTILIACSDNGVGIPEELHARVFDPFFTTRRNSGRPGLGLHVAFNVVTSTLGGTLSLKSESACGTEVSCVLPRDAVRNRKAA